MPVLRDRTSVFVTLCAACALSCGLDVDAEPAPACAPSEATCPDPFGDGAVVPTARKAETRPLRPSRPQLPPDAGQALRPCPPGFTDCNGLCVDLLTDNLNCGRCGVACFPTEQCRFGQCCGVTEELCGNVCTDLSRDEFNCGTCGFRCEPGLDCVLGICTPVTPSSPNVPIGDQRPFPGSPGVSSPISPGPSGVPGF